MPTILEMFDKKAKLILGRSLLSPVSERNPEIPDQLNDYLCFVSRELYCEDKPIEFDISTRQIGDLAYIKLEDGSITDVDGNVLYPCFNDYLFASIEPTLKFTESFQ
jgi:hypothetical protein